MGLLEQEVRAVPGQSQLQMHDIIPFKEQDVLYSEGGVYGLELHVQ